MAITNIIYRCSAQLHCRTFSAALNHSRLFIPFTSTSSVRQFSVSSSDDSVLSLLRSLGDEVKLLRNEVKLVREDIESFCKGNGQTSLQQHWNKDDEACYNNIREHVNNLSDYGNKLEDNIVHDEKTVTKKSEFTDAMATHFNKDIRVSSNNDNTDHDKTVTEKSEFIESMTIHFNTGIPVNSNNDNIDHDKTVTKKSEFTEAMATHFNMDIRVSSNKDNIDHNKTVTKKSEFTEASIKDNIDHDKTVTKKSDFTEAMATSSSINDDNAYVNNDDQSNLNNKTICDSEEKEESIVQDTRDSLLKELQSLISRAEDLGRVTIQGTKFPDDFPYVMTYDNPGTSTVSFLRQYNGENINITVHTPSTFTEIAPELYNYLDTVGFLMRQTVQVSCMTTRRNKIAFHCSAFGSGYIINIVECPEFESDDNALEFRKLSEGLQSEFKKYLQARGFVTSTTNVIYRYMVDKVNREILMLLNELKNMAEA